MSGTEIAYGATRDPARRTWRFGRRAWYWYAIPYAISYAIPDAISKLCPTLSPTPFPCYALCYPLPACSVPMRMRYPPYMLRSTAILLLLLSEPGTLNSVPLDPRP
eukprot:1558441-Rhodomonas_salina.3